MTKINCIEGAIKEKYIYSRVLLVFTFDKSSLYYQKVYSALLSHSFHGRDIFS